MGQQRKFEVLGWSLVINNADKTCVICTGNSSIGTDNDNIEVRAFNPKSNIQGWIDAHGLTCHNIEMLDQPENEMRMLSIQHPERVVNGDLVQPDVLVGSPPPSPSIRANSCNSWTKKKEQS